MLILAEVYLRYTRGFVRIAIIIWFVLIALSPVITYQHHLIDIAGGFVLAAFCFLTFRESDLSSPRAEEPSNNRPCPYELQRTHSALLRAIERVARILESLC